MTLTSDFLFTFLEYPPLFSEDLTTTLSSSRLIPEKHTTMEQWLLDPRQHQSVRGE